MTRAARSLGVSQSTASRRLGELEADLGAALFDRTPDGLLPTELAEQLLPHAELIEEEALHMERLAEGSSHQISGRVRLALPEGLADQVLLPRLPQLQREHPALAVDLLVGPAVVDLVRREADLALRFVRPARGDLIARRLADLDFGVFGTEEQVHAYGSLASARWILLADPEGRFPETRWHRAHVGTPAQMYTNSYNSMLGALRHGLGLGVVARGGAENLGLREWPTPLTGLPSSALYLVTHRALRHVPRIAIVWTWLETIAAELMGR